MPKRRVILLERGNDHRESLLLQVKQVGHEAHVCFDIDECVEAAQRLRPEAILLNAGLPMERVYELGHRLRQSASLPPLVLRVMQPGDQIDCQRSMESGIRYHLAKPVYASILRQMLEIESD